jgi:hypothetical protein
VESYAGLRSVWRGMLDCVLCGDVCWNAFCVEMCAGLSKERSFSLSSTQFNFNFRGKVGFLCST